MNLSKYDQIQHNEPIYYIQQYWNRILTEHEKHLVSLTYDWTRTTQEAEEIRWLNFWRKEAVKMHGLYIDLKNKENTK